MMPLFSAAQAPSHPCCPRDWEGGQDQNLITLAHGEEEEEEEEEFISSEYQHSADHWGQGMYKFEG